MKTTTVREKEQAAFEAMKAEFGYGNPMQAPRLTKVVVSVGVGSVSDKKRQEMIGDTLARIVGQKAAPRNAKKSIASFKVREGQLSGFQITLRGANARGFLDKLFNVALPRTKDFRGLSPNSIDEMGNATIGIKESNVFPELADEDLRNTFGLGITVVTTAKTVPEARAFLRHIGFPFRSAEAAR